MFTFPYKSEGGIPSLFVTTEEQNPVTITVSVPGIGFTHHAAVSRDQMASIDLPEEAAIQDRYGRGKYDRTMIVDATDSVSVHGYYGTSRTADGFLVMPTTVLGRQYVATSSDRYTQWPNDSELAVSATQDETTVVIGDPVGVAIVLQQYETYHYVAYSSFATDVTGVFVTADKPISVMSGHQCGFVPVGVLACDYLMEHIPPISALGRHYVLAPFMGRQSGYIFRVVSAARGMTNITISDGQTESLLAGQYYQGDVATNVVITISADKPIAVSQYAKGVHSDNVTGDPFMIVIPSTHAYSNNVSFPVATLSRNPQQSYISVITACQYSDSITLDDQPLSSLSVQMLRSPQGDYCLLQTPVTNGSHSVTHPSQDASFLVLVYGFAWAESYGYVAGYNIGSADIPSTISTGT